VTGTQRLFVAVDLPSYAVDHLTEITQGLHVARARARLAAPERWHITLAFIGEVPDDREAAAHQAVHAAATGPSAASFTMRIAGGGTFGGRNAVLWAGVSGEVDRLTKLARAVARELRRARFDIDRKKPFRPHMTIARPGDRVDRARLREDIAMLSGYEGPPWQVTEVHLVRSFLGPNPRHVRIASFPLPS